MNEAVAYGPPFQEEGQVEIP